MPSTSRASKNTASPTEIPPTQQTFRFPEDRHLVITTPRHVFTWDASGVHTTFSSSRGSIVAAKEAKDGSGVLAIASRNVVVMHDTRRGKEESWGLSAPQDEVRHLEYAPDAKTLYLTTMLDGSVQKYSTERSRLLTPTQKLEDAPMALAISPTGHLLLSASHRPPVVHLKNTAHNTPPLQIHPNASSAPVSSATFHPERPNVFLLAFRDGTIAIYDATKLSRLDKDSSSGQSATDGELARTTVAHRAVLTGDDDFRASTVAPPIAGAAFLPGFKARVVTAGRDGRCKLIDFSKGGEVLRTWHAKAPITSLAVLALRSSAESRSRNKSVGGTQRNRSSGSHTIGGPTSTSSIIAVSRVDGKVQLYDSVGLLVAETIVSSQEERILGLEWAKGPALAQRPTDRSMRRFSDDCGICITRASTGESDVMQAVPNEQDDGDVPSAQAETELGLPSALKGSRSQTGRKFTLHPDEVEDSTVRYTPSPEKKQSLLPSRANYHDLFSPVKPVVDQRLTSPSNRRPRISSQTFTQNTLSSPQTGLAVQSRRQSGRPGKATEVRSATIDSVGQLPPPLQAAALKPIRRVSTNISSTSKSRRQITFAHDGSNRSIKSARQPAINTNAQILADVRKLSKGTSSARHGTLSSCAASQRPGKGSILQTMGRYPAKQRAVEADPADSMTWPTDSASLSGDIASNDIWLTSDSEDESSRPRERRRKPLARPPARQTSRSKVVSGMTISTAPDTRSSMHMQQHTIDGSTDEQMFSAASHLSPASEDVREMFPRTSSLSPGKKHRIAKNRRASPAKRTALVTVQPNVHPKSPWARAKAKKATIPVQMYEDPTLISGALPQSDGLQCLTCPETKTRVQGLETEVAHLKGEVLALKAILRRNGLPFPACLR